MMVVGLAGILGLAAGCSTKTSDVDLEVTTAPKVTNLLANSHGQTVLVDVRTASDYAAGHIPGAINIYILDITEGDPRLADAKTIVVYSSGQDMLSWAAAKKMLALGYKNVMDFRGGLAEWKNNGGAVTKGK